VDVETLLGLFLKYPTEEILTVEELRELLEVGARLRHYIGFEISGFIHLGTGVVSMMKVVDLQKAGVDTQILLADIHSWLNNKLGGDLDTIKRVAVTYYKETLSKAVEVLGGDPSRVKFILGSEFYSRNDEYWLLFMDVVRHVTLHDVKHSLTILGRKMGDSVPFAWLVYPPLQVADVFALGAHIPHGGLDQRRAHIMAREVALKIRFYPLTVDGRRIKPIALHHKLLPALSYTGRPESKEELSEMKMSKSLPHTAIFLHDDVDTIREKVRRAYCPPRAVEQNVVLELARLSAFREERKAPFVVERPAEYGGGREEFWSFEELAKAYESGRIHPLDLKNAVAEELVKFLEPIAKWFSSGRGAKLLEEMKGIVVSR